MKLFTVLLCICFFISTTYAGCGIKTPFGTTTWIGGQKGNVTWEEDNTPPLLGELGDIMIDLLVGAHIKVCPLATLVKATDLVFTCTIPANIGPESDVYFVKLYNNNSYVAYSHTFSIRNVSGSIQGFDPKNPSQPGTTDNANNTMESHALGNNNTTNTTTTPSNQPPTSNNSPAKSTTANAPSSTTKTSNANSLMVYPTFVGLSLVIINFALSHVL
ncbi:hypothetical protein C2G38_2256373 [Gigaspora rosea]|uniref:Ser-Thr-rich glycosyl-phosphatidyl-inositol-anchored membrane family-domain-containing protein n=1 Tax=Gigaspora rosea TaxID=44941 RepID=A0A397TUG4_9GLOM|nr:hypothetical protein C2G38_2256373 [Gigaspora rosea]